MAATDRALFVVNRAAQRRREHLEARAGEQCRRHGLEAVVLDSMAETGDWDEGVALLASRIAGLEAAVVVAVGGDGTVGACAQAAVPLGVPLGVVPRGAANLVANALGLPFGIDPALSVALGAGERLVDVAVVNGRSFVAMAGLGLDAAVVRATSAPLKRRLGWLSYAVIGASRLGASPADFEIRLDGGSPLLRRARTVVVGNVGLLPGGFPLLPGAKLDDGLLDVGLLAPEGALGWFELAGHLLAARLHDAPPGVFVENHQARRIEISADRALGLEADGEVLPDAKVLSVELRPGSLRIRVPRI